MCATLNSVINKPDDLEKYLDECFRLNIVVLPPDINKSDLFFTVEKGCIRLGLCSIKGVGKNAAREIKEVTSRTEINHIRDLYLLGNKTITKTVLSALIFSGAFDFMGYSRRALWSYTEKLLAIMKKVKQKINGNSKRKNPVEDISTFYEPVYELELEDLPENNIKELLDNERQLVGFNISGDSLYYVPEEYTRKVTEVASTIDGLPNNRMVKMLGEIEDLKEIAISKGRQKGETMCKATIRDLTGNITITVFPDVYKKKKHILEMDNVIIFQGNINYYNDQVQVIMKDCRKVEFEDN